MVNFLQAAIIAVVYVLFLFVEMRFVLKENKPMKRLLRDGLLVYLSVLLGEFVLNQLGPLKTIGNSVPSVFTNEPDF